MFPGLTLKIAGEYDFFIFPGGAMKALPVEGEKDCWTIEFIWDDSYGVVNEYAKNWAIRQLTEGRGLFSGKRISEIWDHLNGRWKEEVEWA